MQPMPRRDVPYPVTPLPCMTGDIVFELKGACAGYNGRPVLFDVDLTVRAGERIAVMGRSGAGKSTLLGLLHAQRPTDVALVPQVSALVKPLSVFHNVYMGRLDCHSTAYNLRNLVWPAACRVAEVRSVLESVGLDGEIFRPGGRAVRRTAAAHVGGASALQWTADPDR